MSSSSTPSSQKPEDSTKRAGEATIVQHSVTKEDIPKVETKEEGKHHYLLCQDLFDLDASAAALKYARERLVQPGDVVIIFTALPSRIVDPYLGINSGIVAQTEAYFQEQEKRYEHQRQGALKQLYHSAKGFREGVEVHIRLAVGDALSEVIAAAEYHQCDMVIVGRRKLGKFERFISAGGFSTGLLSNTQLSVLVVR